MGVPSVDPLLKELEMVKNRDGGEYPNWCHYNESAQNPGLLSGVIGERSRKRWPLGSVEL